MSWDRGAGYWHCDLAPNPRFSPERLESDVTALTAGTAALRRTARVQVSVRAWMRGRVALPFQVNLESSGTYHRPRRLKSEVSKR